MTWTIRNASGAIVITHLDAVALGSGKCVEEFEALQQVLISEPRH